MRDLRSHDLKQPMPNRLPIAVLGAVLLVIGAHGPLGAHAAGLQANQPTGRLRIVVLDGEAGVNIIDQKTAVAPVVEVRDRNDLPVVGAQVTFLIRSGAGRATLNNGLRQVTLTTNAAGRATVAVNPVARGAVQLQVNAAYQGQTAAATITQTNFATAAQAASASSAGSSGASGSGAGGSGGAGGGLSMAAITGITGAAVGGVVAATQLGGGDDSSSGGGGGSGGSGSGAGSSGGGSVACSFSLSQTSITTGSAGGATTVTVTASPSGCTNGGWTASSNSSFVTVSPTSGNGSNNVIVTVAANTSGVSRTATVTIANQSVSVTQSAGCTFAVSPNPAAIPATGGSVSFNITATPSGCAPATWTATNISPFLTLSATSGTAPTTVTVSAAANGTGSSRNGTFTISGTMVTVSQAAAGTSNVTGNWTVTAGGVSIPFQMSQESSSLGGLTSTFGTFGGVNFNSFIVIATGTITGSAVRMDVRYRLVVGFQSPCEDTDVWSLTLNTATSMSGTGTKAWVCGNFRFNTPSGVTLTK